VPSVLPPLNKEKSKKEVSGVIEYRHPSARRGPNPRNRRPICTWSVAGSSF